MITYHVKGGSPLNPDPELDDLRKAIDKSISRMATQEIIVPPERIKSFCEIIGETNPVYFERKEARRAGFERIPLPESYLLTLITPLSHELFTTGIGHLFGSVIRGIVHTSSEIEFYAPLYCDTPYGLKLECTGLVRKKGKMGEYLVGTFPHKVFDARNRLVAMDSHVFFLRTA
jgi:hypothetical protein